MKTQHLIGRITDRELRVIVEVNLDDASRLTVRSNATVDDLHAVDDLAPGWTSEDQVRLGAIWQHWHNSDEPMPESVRAEVARLQSLPRGDVPD